MKKWQSSPHTIADIREWNNNGTLLLQPDYQRREVWGEAAKIMLIDSILNDIPMPKIFVSKEIKDMRTYRSVIDGQQRISTILNFLEDAFKLENPYRGAYDGKKFSELSSQVQDELLLYSIDFNEASGLPPEELREVYSRVNKYLVPLNKQELRRADFPGDFLKISEELANLDALDEMGLFNATSRRRSLDTEYVSELLAAQLKGISDKKDLIDVCYRDFMSWSESESSSAKKEFKSVLSDISIIFDASYPMKKTRWKQKSDFYSLFCAVLNLRRKGYQLPDNVDYLRQDLSLLNERISPTTEVLILSKYAVYCVSQANSASSRNWRTQFIEAFLRGTYSGNIDDEGQRNVLLETAVDIRFSTNFSSTRDGCPPSEGFVCEGCRHVDEGEASLVKSVLYWPSDAVVFQLSNANWAHIDCLPKVNAGYYIEGESLPEADQYGYESDYDDED